MVKNNKLEIKSQNYSIHDFTCSDCDYKKSCKSSNHRNLIHKLHKKKFHPDVPFDPTFTTSNLKLTYK